MHTELETAEASAPPIAAGKMWRTIRSFVFWSYERGTVQYDVMVTIILLFVFLSPRLINFNDRPVERNPNSTGVLVYPDGQGGLVYQVEARAVPHATAQDDAAVRAALLRVIEPISGEVSISRYEAVRDNKGQVRIYKVWVQR